MNSLVRSRALAAVLAVLMLATACGSDPTEVVIGVADDTAADNADSVDDAVANDSAPLVETTTTESNHTTTTGPPPPPRATTVVGAPAAYETLGSSMIGTGQWAIVRGANSPESEDLECGHDSTLAYVVDGEVVHKYDELGMFSGIRLFNGTNGQDAFVLNCEESVVGLFLQMSSVVPDRGYPYLQEIDFSEDLSDAEPSFFFSDEWGWSGDLFVGWGSLRGVSQLWTFGIPDAVAVPVSDLLGNRAPTNPDLAVSVVVPRGWTYQSTSDSEVLTHPSSSSRVQVWSSPEIPDPPLEEGDDLLSHDVANIRLWSTPTAGASAEPSLPVPVDEWTFLSNDGVRVVRYFTRESETVVIELFADTGDGAVDQDVPWLVLDTLRLFAG